MGYKLHALFLETETKTYFFKYFWESFDAIVVGEAASELIDKRVIGYRIEEHKISEKFDIYNEQQYYQLAENYEFVFQL